MVSRSRIYNGTTKQEPFPGYGGTIVDYALDHQTTTLWAQQLLPEQLAMAIDFTQGSWSAPLPSAIPSNVVHTFHQGMLPEPPVSVWQRFATEHVGAKMSQQIASSLGCEPDQLIIVPKASLVMYAAQWIDNYITTSPSALCLIRDMHGSPVADQITWSTAYGLFYPLAGQGWDMDRIADLLDDAAGSSGEFIVHTRHDELSMNTANELSTEQITALMTGACDIMLGAYDGEGYVRWSRNRSSRI